MTLKQALSWIEQYDNLNYQHSDRKLERIQTLVELCGNPHKNLHIIHIAGSKGKSSTAFALSNLLSLAGETTGLFISPHVETYNERIKINDLNIDDESLLWGIQKVKHILEEENSKREASLRLYPTMFEKLFTACLMIFKQKKVKWGIIEVGLGGIYDSTNIVHPKLSIISTIEKEHSNILGKTLEDIAQQKAGIIKKHSPVLIGKQLYPNLNTIFSQKTEQERAVCYFFSDIAYYKVLQRSNADYTDATRIELTLHIENRAYTYMMQTSSLLKCIAEDQLLALCAFHILCSHRKLDYALLNTITAKHTFKETKQLVHSKKNNTNYPMLQFASELACRAELLYGNPPLYLDLAHTPKSLAYSLGFVSLRFTPLVLIMGLSKDKDANSILQEIETLLPRFEKIIITSAGKIKPMPARKLYTLCKKNQQNFSSINCISDYYRAFKKGISIAEKKHALLVVVGSTYLCSDLRKEYLLSQKQGNVHVS